MQAHFAKYKEQEKPGAFAVSLDGRSAGWSFCAEYYCESWSRIPAAIHACEKSGKECRIYAIGRTIVWDPTLKQAQK